VLKLPELLGESFFFVVAQSHFFSSNLIENNIKINIKIKNVWHVRKKTLFSRE
jgi:hypothetical protein